MAAIPPICVSVHDLTKRYGSRPAIQGVSFEVSTGEIFGLLGPNGAGKTTTLECILGLRRPDSGTIVLDGIDALAHPDRVRPLIGAQLQEAALQDKITARQALRLFGSFYRQPAAAGELLERFGLVEKADAAFDSLSGGQRQRLFLALAFVNHPRLVVLDEPTAGLDPPARRALHACLTALRESGKTILLSTHHLDEAQHLCDRLGVLDAGRLVAVDTPASLISGAHAPPRVLVRTARPLSPAQVRQLPGVVDSAARNGGWTLGTTDVTRTVVEVTRQLAAEGNELLDLQIQRPSLEDVFLELTGRAWSPADES